MRKPPAGRMGGGSARRAHLYLRRASLALLTGALLGPAIPGLAAAPVEIRYHKEVWPCDPKRGIQFLSPTEGWIGVWGIASGRGKPNQPYLLTTHRGPDDLHPVAGLQLPPEHALNDFFFLDRQLGWVVVSKMQVRGGPTRLWRTEDGGRTWQELMHNLPRAGGQLQFVTPTVGWLLGRELWRTEDGGTVWRHLSLQPGEEETSFTDMVFLSPVEGWVTGRGTIRHTTDGGETWTLQYDMSDTERPWPWTIQALSPTEAWVAGGQHLLHTRDGGQTWRPLRARHRRMGPFDRFTAVHFLSAQVGVVAGQHNARETVSKAVQRRASPIAFSYYRPYLLVTFDGGRSWSYHDIPIPVGQWSPVGTTLFGINTVDWTHEATGIVEVHLTPPRPKAPKR